MYNTPDGLPTCAWRQSKVQEAQGVPAGHNHRNPNAQQRETSTSKHTGNGLVGIDTSSSSQYLSALLLASPLIPKPTVLRAEGRLPSWPYVAMGTCLGCSRCQCCENLIVELEDRPHPTRRQSDPGRARSSQCRSLPGRRPALRWQCHHHGLARAHRPGWEVLGGVASPVRATVVLSAQRD